MLPGAERTVPLAWKATLDHAMEGHLGGLQVDLEPLRRCALSIAKIPGWFDALEARLFTTVNACQQQLGVGGDLLEIGAYMGKSAVLLGAFRRPGDALHVCDLFGDDAEMARNSSELRLTYADLTRSRFESNFRAAHGDLPVIHQCSSTDLEGQMLPDVFRLVHVDGSHLQEIVRQDIELVARHAGDGSVVIFDDYRNIAVPGVGAAVWEATTGLGLRPVLLTPTKLYATWADRDQVGIRRMLLGAVHADAKLAVGDELLFGEPVAIVSEAPPRGVMAALARARGVATRVRMRIRARQLSH